MKMKLEVAQKQINSIDNVLGKVHDKKKMKIFQISRKDKEKAKYSR